MARELPKVIEQMLLEIPAESTELRVRLQSIRESSEYSAPSMQKFWWLRGAEILSAKLSDTKEPPTEGWQLKVYNIWMNKENESCPSSSQQST